MAVLLFLFPLTVLVVGALTLDARIRSDCRTFITGAQALAVLGLCYALALVDIWRDPTWIDNGVQERLASAERPLWAFLGASAFELVLLPVWLGARLVCRRRTCAPAGPHAHSKPRAPPAGSLGCAHMMRPLTVPPAARAAFVATLAELTDHIDALPDPLPLGRVLRVVDRSKDSEEALQVLAGQDERGFFLDYYRVDQDRDGETSSHGRVRDTGSLERLENYDGQYGREIFPDDPAKTEAELQRILAHNARVREVLRAKGFL